MDIANKEIIYNFLLGQIDPRKEKHVKELEKVILKERWASPKDYNFDITFSNNNDNNDNKVEKALKDTALTILIDQNRELTLKQVEDLYEKNKLEIEEKILNHVSIGIKKKRVYDVFKDDISKIANILDEGLKTDDLFYYAIELPEEDSPLFYLKYKNRSSLDFYLHKHSKGSLKSLIPFIRQTPLSIEGPIGHTLVSREGYIDKRYKDHSKLKFNFIKTIEVKIKRSLKEKKPLLDFIDSGVAEITWANKARDRLTVYYRRLKKIQNSLDKVEVRDLKNKEYL